MMDFPLIDADKLTIGAPQRSAAEQHLKENNPEGVDVLFEPEILGSEEYLGRAIGKGESRGVLVVVS